MKEKIVRILLIGFGNVGSGTREVIERKKEKIYKKYGIFLKIVGIGNKNGLIINENGLTTKEIEAFKRGERIDEKDTLKIIKSLNYEVLVEATPTNIENGEPGLSHIISALETGKNVVTSNKGPIALAYKKLMKLAKEKQKKLKFGATVGGALPIISLAKNELQEREIISIKGILNGTSNYILTKMTKERLSLEQALKKAQQMGIAETDPSKDIDGIDTAIKLVILANAVFGICATLKDVKIKGIREITSEFLRLAEKSGYAVKLIGKVNKDGLLKVEPQLIPKNDPLNVDDTLNVVKIKTELADEITILGKGAGPIETASAVLSDIVGIYKNYDFS